MAAAVIPRRQKRRQRLEGGLNHNEIRTIVTDLLSRDFWEGRTARRGVDSAGLAMYFQRVVLAAGPDSAAGAGEEGGMVKYIAIGSYWLGVVCSLAAVLGRICDALGIAFVRILTKGNNIDVRSFLDAGLLFLFIAIASANYEWLQSRQRGS
jgi:hypothetical protein